MKTLVLILAITLSINLLFGQNEPRIYLPNAEPYMGKGKTFGQINNDLEKHGRVYVYMDYEDKDDPNVMIGFKLFTAEPLWIYIKDTSKIQKAINSYNLYEFLHSWNFESELERYIELGTLSDIFILETLGQPDNKTKYFDKDFQLDRWTYSKLGITLSFKNGIVISYIKIE